MLCRSLEPAAAEQENIEYTKQLILICLLNICQKLCPDGEAISKGTRNSKLYAVQLILQTFLVFLVEKCFCAVRVFIRCFVVMFCG